MTKSDDSDLTIYQEHSSLPKELPALAALFDEAKHANLRVLALARRAEDGSQKAIAKRRHDLIAALRTLGFTVTALKTGYTFQDDKAAAKIEAIAKAVQIVEREAGVLTQLLLGDAPR